MRVKALVVFIVSTIILTAACSKKKAIPEAEIMARVGDRVITTDEYLQRAEYTIRPPYARQNLYIHKKIILNSLIAEKLLALDAGDSCELAKSEKFNLFVRGRKEQVMRQLFFQKNMYDKVKLKKKEIDEVFKRAGRTYDIEFVSTTNKEFSDYIQNEVFHKNRDLGEVVLEKVNGDSLPRRQVQFSMQEIDQVRSALYEQDVKKGQVIGPIKIEDENLYIKVLGWTDRVAMASHDIQNRWEDVNQHLNYKYAKQIYDKYVGKLMKGKRLDFNRDTFVALVNILGPVYFPDPEKKQIDIQRNLWGKSVPEEGLPDSLKQRLQQIEDRPLLVYDGQVWTVNDLGREMVLHPLQFRKREFPRQEFANQLKLAIADLIRDKAITQEAYRQKLDQNRIVKTKEQMWRDAYLADYLRDRKLEDLGVLQNFKKNYLEIIETYLNPVVDSLQAKYSDIIEINTDALENVVLTRIDMFAIYQDQPYPVIVPNFPLLTTDAWLDYGKKLNERPN